MRQSVKSEELIVHGIVPLSHGEHIKRNGNRPGNPLLGPVKPQPEAEVAPSPIKRLQVLLRESPRLVVVHMRSPHWAWAAAVDKQLPLAGWTHLYTSQVECESATHSAACARECD